MPMKARAVILIDYEFNTFLEAASEHEKIQMMIDNLIKDNPHARYSDFDFKERRGNTKFLARNAKFVKEPTGKTS